MRSSSSCEWSRSVSTIRFCIAPWAATKAASTCLSRRRTKLTRSRIKASSRGAITSAACPVRIESSRGVSRRTSPRLRTAVEADPGRRGEMIDVIAKRLLGRDPARRGVRLTQVTTVFQLGHHVAHHRSAHAQLMARDDLRRTYRLGGRDELLHRREDQRVTPVRERVDFRFLRHLTWRWRAKFTFSLGPSIRGAALVSIVLRIQRYIQAPS